MDIVRRELEVPPQPARIDVERHERARVQVVPLAQITVPIRTRVTRAPVEQPQLRIVGTRQPGRSAAMFPRVAGPGVAARFTGCRNRPESPDPLTALRIVRVEEAANAGFAPADTDDDLPVDGERRRRDRVPRPILGYGNAPTFAARGRVQGDQIAVERPDVDGAVDDGDTAVDAGEAQIQHAWCNRPAPLPEGPPAADAQRDDRRRTRRDVHRPVGHDRRALQRAGARRLVDPRRTETRNIVDGNLREWRKAVSLVRSRIREPLASRAPVVCRRDRRLLRKQWHTHRRGKRENHPSCLHRAPLRLARYATRSSNSAADRSDL